MKTVIRIFNFIIMGISALAMILLFATSTFSFNSCISVKSNFFNTLIPANEYTGTIDVSDVIGVEDVYLTLKVDLGFSKVSKLMGSSDKEAINEAIIRDNVNSLVDQLHEPVNYLTEYTVRTVLKKIAHDQIFEQIEKSASSYMAEHPEFSVEDVMSEVGITDDFEGFAKDLYEAGNVEHPTVESFTDVIFTLIEQIIDEASVGTAGRVDRSMFGPAQKTSIREGFVTIFDDLGLIKEDGEHLVRIEKLSYVYLNDLLVKDLLDDYSPTELAPSVEEALDEELYSKRLVYLYIGTVLPEAYYGIVGYVSLGLFIAFFLFEAIWAILLLITILRTFSVKKPWTIFGPWFWIVGSLQIVLGLALTIFGKYYLAKLIPLDGTPISSLAVAPRTFALIPSIIFIVMIVFGIVYAVFRSKYKSELRRDKMKKDLANFNEGGVTVK